MTRICGFRRCKQPFEPVFGQEETQKYCSPECGNSERVQRWNDRHKAKPNGGGPGGKRQKMLFSRSELHRRKPNKIALKAKPKQEDMFPAEGDGLFATQAGGVEYVTLPDGTSQVTCYRTRKKAKSAPAPNLKSHPAEAHVAA